MPITSLRIPQPVAHHLAKLYGMFVSCYPRYCSFFSPFMFVCSTAKFIPEPEIYQCHFFVGFHEKKKYAACLALSNAALYVCTLKSGMPATVKEKFPAEKITALAAVPGNDHALKVTLGDITAVCITADAEDCNALFVVLRFFHLP